MKSWVFIALVWTCSLAQLIIIDNADSRFLFKNRAQLGITIFRPCLKLDPCINLPEHAQTNAILMVE